MRLISWEEFNLCIDNISRLCKDKKFCGVYGFPRGGLCLAVALSHSLNIPLLNKPQKNSLVIDDVYETGKTLSQVAVMEGITTFVWFSKVEPKWWSAVQIADPKEWIVLPWENYHLAEQDKKTYDRSRL